MKLRRRLRPLRGEIEATPLINVVLLLFIFFILISSFVFQPGIRVDLPRGAGAGSLNTRYIVAISAQQPSQMYFNDQIVTYEILVQRFKQIAQKEVNPSIILKADKKVSHGEVARIMNLAVNEGLSVVIATQQP